MATALNGSARIEARDGYVFAWHGRAAKTVEEANEVIQHLETALGSAGVDRLVFDSRESDRTPEDVQARLWEWLQGARLTRVATLVQSDMLGISVKMTGLSKGVKIRAFDDEAEAVAWVLA